MGSLGVQIKILNGKSPLMFTWWNDIKDEAEACLITCPCQGYNFPTVKRRRTDAQNEKVAEKLRQAMQVADVISLSCGTFVTSTKPKRPKRGQKRKTKSARIKGKQTKLLKGVEILMNKGDRSKVEDSEKSDDTKNARNIEINVNMEEEQEGLTEKEHSKEGGVRVTVTGEEGEPHLAQKDDDNHGDREEVEALYAEHLESSSCNTKSEQREDTNVNSEADTNSSKIFEDSTETSVKDSRMVVDGDETPVKDGMMVVDGDETPVKDSMMVVDGDETPVKDSRMVVDGDDVDVEVGPTGGSLGEEKAHPMPLAHVRTLEDLMYSQVASSEAAGDNGPENSTFEETNSQYVISLSDFKNMNNLRLYKEKFTEKDGCEICEICGMSFSTHKLKRHMMSVHASEERERKHVCDYCGKAFLHAFNLKRHILVHKGVKFSCAYCKKLYKYEFYRDNHERVCLENPSVRAFLGDRGTSSIKDLEYSHTDPSQENEEVKDDESGKSDPQETDQGLTQGDEKEEDGNKDRKPRKSGRIYQCSICSKIWASKQDYLRHLLTHGGRYKKYQGETREKMKCRFCWREFNTYHSVLSHELTHEDVYTPDENTPLTECELCSRQVPTAIYKRHLATHRSASPERVQCKECGKMLKKSYIKMHMDFHSDKMYTCRICGNMVKYACRYAHDMTHKKNRKYTCEICEKTFSSNGARKAHMRSHTNEKPFKCNYCDERFARAGLRINHERLHTGEKPYHCPICDKNWRDRTTYRGHMTKHHPGEPLQYLSKTHQKRSELAFQQEIASSETVSVPCVIEEVIEDASSTDMLEREIAVHIISINEIVKAAADTASISDQSPPGESLPVVVSDEVQVTVPASLTGNYQV